MSTKSARKVLRQARKGMRPPPGDREASLAALHARLEDPTDPELPDVPRLAEPGAGPSVRVFAAVLAVAATIALAWWFANGSAVVTPTPHQDPVEAPDQVEPPRRNGEVVPAAAEEHESSAPVQPQPDPVQPPPDRKRPVPVASPPAPSEADAMAQEVALVRQAKAALRAGDAQRALTLCREHAERFATGSLAPERYATAIAAQCAMGRDDAAAAEARRFAAAVPSSQLARTLSSQPCPARKDVME